MQKTIFKNTVSTIFRKVQLLLHTPPPHTHTRAAVDADNIHTLQTHVYFDYKKAKDSQF